MMISSENYLSFIWIWIITALLIFVVLLFVTAPYGRHAKTTWGPMIDNRLGWFLMEFFVLVVVAFFVLTGTNEQSLVNLILLALFFLHYVNRSILFPLRMHTRGKKMPVAIMLMGITFNLVNGGLIGLWFGDFKIYDTDWLTTPRFILGIILFFLGLQLNWRSDTRLIHLRKSRDTGYKIPAGGMFKWVSCPNLLGEITEWLGFAILTWSLPGWAFFIWTLANLFPRALAHHRWYLKQFPDYPKDRKAIIPWII